MAIPVTEAREHVASLFIAYLGRAPEYQAMNFYIGQLNSYLAESDDNIGDALLKLSAEIYNNAGGAGEIPVGPNVTNEEFVTWTYQNVLGRAPDAEGLAYYVGLLEDGTLTREIFVHGFLDNVRGQEEGRDFDYVSNRVDVAVEFSQWANSNPNILPTLPYDSKTILAGVNEDPASVEAALEEIAGGTAGSTSFDLTKGVDILTGGDGNDVFNASPVNASDSTLVNTLNAFDVIDGGAGVDTLNIYTVEDGGKAYNTDQVGTIKNIEIVNIHHSADAVFGGAAIDASKFGGLQQLWQFGHANDVTNVGAGQTLGFSGPKIGDGGIDIGAAKGVTSVAVAVDVTDGATFNFTGDKLSTVSLSGSLPSTDGEPAVLGVGLTDKVTTLNLSFDTDIDLWFSNPAVKGGSLKTLDASESTGGVFLDASGANNGELALTSASFGSGDDELLVHQGGFKAKEVSVDLGAGDDVLEVTLSDNEIAVSITGGEGNDIFVFLGGNVEINDDDEFVNSVTITDFGLGDDLLVLENFQGWSAQLAVNNLIGSLGADATLEEVVEAVAGLVDQTETTGLTGWAQFVFGGNTYVYGNNADVGADAGLAAGDLLITLIGEVTLNSDNVIQYVPEL